MTRRSFLQPEFVEAIPERIDEGRLYISERFRTAVHRCCCGCGLEVVTPLNSAKWRLTRRGDTVSLHPSVGNWSFPCRSHYVIDGNRVLWAGPLGEWQVEQVRRRDARAAEALHRPQVPATREPEAETESGWWKRFMKWWRAD